MMRSKSRCSDTSEEPNEDSLMEAELARLQRSYRVMQNDYKAYREETKRVINKQDSLINGLNSEKTELDTCLSKMKTTQNKNKDTQNAEKLTELSLTDKDFQRLIKEERDKIKDLDAQILEVEKKTADQRKSMGGFHNCTARHIATHKKKAVLENRLDKAIVNFNRQLAINRTLREDIDHLRREKDLFENLFRKLSRELDGCKREMSDIIEASTQAYEQRDEAQNKILALKDRSDKDQAQHDLEMKDLMRMITHDNKIKEFMNIKACDRVHYKAEEQAKKAMKGGDGDRQNKADLETIKTYEDAFRKVQEVTGESDITVIVNEFIKKEEENFALFNYVNELNTEVETLSEEMSKLKNDIAVFESEAVVKDENRVSLMRDLQDKHDKIITEREAADKRMKEIAKVLDQIKGSIGLMFKQIDCDPKPIQEMLDAEDGITEKNIMLYLGLIEMKTNELLSYSRFLQYKKDLLDGPIDKNKVNVLQKAPSLTLNIPPPDVVDESEEETLEEEPKPLTEAEIRARVARGMHRRMAPPVMTQAPRATVTSRDGKKKKK